MALDARGYLGLVRQTVLAVRAQSVTASRALPPFEQQLLGGMASLRGYDVGSQVGDNLAAMSAELLMPITSPLSLARLGVKLFADTGTVYAAGTVARRSAIPLGIRRRRLRQRHGLHLRRGRRLAGRRRHAERARAARRAPDALTDARAKGFSSSSEPRA